MSLHVAAPVWTVKEDNIAVGYPERISTIVQYLGARTLSESIIFHFCWLLFMEKVSGYTIV